jgi:hypothetical protein
MSIVSRSVFADACPVRVSFFDRSVLSVRVRQKHQFLRARFLMTLFCRKLFSPLQVNVSLAADKRDMRVLAFEDRTDCTACLTLMARWPEYEGTDPRVRQSSLGGASVSSGRAGA